MNDRRRVIVFSVLVLICASMISTGLTIYFLYYAALNQQRERLTEVAQSQARLIEAIARFDKLQMKDYSGDYLQATLDQIRDAHGSYSGFGRTGEFTLAGREGDYIVFILSHRHYDVDKPKPVPFDSELAEPMRKALSGESGTIVGPDYRGEIVLAAHEPIKGLNLGIVAKIDLSEIREPFVWAGLYAGGAAFVVAFVGSMLFLRVTNRFILRLEDSEESIKNVAEELKKHRDNLEEQVEERTFELKEANKQLLSEIVERKKNEGRLRGLVDASPDLFILFDREGRYLDILTSQKQLLVEEERTLIGKRVVDVIPLPFARRFVERLNRVIESGSLEVMEYELDVIAGRRWFEGRLAPVIQQAGATPDVVFVARDITDRKLAEERIKASLKEKEILLQEIHHRVKNNMAVISSLLNIQAREIQDERLREIFNESQTRIHALTIIHESLYQSDSLSEIKLKQYLSALTKNLSRAYRTIAGQVSINIEAEDIVFGIDLAVPCGLVVTELVSNSLKYAFPEGRAGVITVHARSGDRDEIIITISDNGVGLPAGIDVMKTETIGLRLVRNLVIRQLNGTLELNREHGAQFIIRFKQTAYRKRV